MQIPKQVPPVQRVSLRRGEIDTSKRFEQWMCIQSSEISVLPLSDIANDPSFLFGEQKILNKDPLIHFDIEKPITPIEMCDVYCDSQRCDVFCIDAKEKIVHGHIYDGLFGQITQENLNVDMSQRIVHGHIYGDVDRQDI